MHPLWSHRRRLAWYGALWLGLGLALALLLHAVAQARPGAALALALPLALVYAVACLALWYSCRALPLGGNPWPAVGTHVAAAAVAGALWMLLAQGLAGLAQLAGTGAPWRAAAALPLIGGLGVLLYLLAAAGYYLVLGAQAAGAAERRAIAAQAAAAAAQALAREAELRALKAQIKPHFLFNSLHSISALTASDPTRARQMCILLGDFLRQTLALGERGEHALVPLGEELDLVHAYVAIEQVRYGARLRLEEAVAPAALAAPVPALLLQPLVENAVVHGIAHMLEEGWIRLEAECAGGRLRLGVSNSFDAASPRRPGTGLGLANVRQRLQALFGAGARLQAEARADGFYATLELPSEAQP